MPRTRAWAALALLAVPALGAPVQGQGRPAEPPGAEHPRRSPSRRLLFRMVRADQRVAYSGREVLVMRGRNVEMDVRFDPRRGMRRESVQPPGEILVDDTKRSWFLSTREKRLVERESMLARLQSRWKELLQAPPSQLKIERQGEDTVAGRVADILLVAPPDGASGPSRRFWIDRETGLRLRMEEKDPDGRIVVSAYFLKIDLAPDLKDADFAPLTAPAGVRTVRDSRRSFDTFDEASRAGFAPPIPGYLPSGYAAQRVDVGDNGGWISAHWGNGLSVISLTQMRRTPPGPMRSLPENGEPRPWPLPGGRKGMAWRRGESVYLLIAPLAEDILRKIADSVR